MKQATISVIIPTYNEEEKIACLLQSLAKLPDLEIIVSDGGSCDRTSEVCGRFPVKFIRGQLGRGRQLNAGAAGASGDILLFLHADSEIEPGVFDDIRDAVSQGHKWGCCTLCFDDDALFFNLLTKVSRLRASVFSSCYGDQGIFCERQLFFSLGGFPAFPFLEDLAFSRKLRRHTRAKVIPGRITTASRRFKAGGPLKTLAKMQVIKLLYTLGVSPERLVELYHFGYKEGNPCSRQLW